MTEMELGTQPENVAREQEERTAVRPSNVINAAEARRMRKWAGCFTEGIIGFVKILQYRPATAGRYRTI